jgi:hypothetical protein
MAQKENLKYEIACCINLKIQKNSFKLGVYTRRAANHSFHIFIPIEWLASQYITPPTQCNIPLNGSFIGGFLPVPYLWQGAATSKLEKNKKFKSNLSNSNLLQL